MPKAEGGDARRTDHGGDRVRPDGDAQFVRRRAACGGLRRHGPGGREALELEFPGFWDSLVQDDRLRRGLSVAVNSEMQPLGLLARVPAGAELHILPAMSGGALTKRRRTPA